MMLDMSCNILNEGVVNDIQAEFGKISHIPWWKFKNIYESISAY